jgi:hypothetical protein
MTDAFILFCGVTKPARRRADAAIKLHEKLIALFSDLFYSAERRLFPPTVISVRH